MAKSKRAMPWGMFYWSDYAGDPQLKLCSLAAQGLWMRMLCVAGEHDPVGYVAVNGQALGAPELARMVGEPSDLIGQLLDELDSRGVFSRDRRGFIYSRRMINDSKRRDRASKNGKLGGNPSLLEQRENSGSDKGEDKDEDKAGHKLQSPESRVQRKEPSVPKTLLPEDWEPEQFGEGSESRAVVDGWSEKELKAQLEGFHAHHAANGSRYTNWQQAWSTWVLNSRNFAPRNRHDRPGAASTGDAFLDAMAADYLPKEK